jgi:hypothetical protein
MFIIVILPISYRIYEKKIMIKTKLQQTQHRSGERYARRRRASGVGDPTVDSPPKLWVTRLIRDLYLEIGTNQRALNTVS